MVDLEECYQEAARSAAEGRLSCCAPCAPELFGAQAYSRYELAGLPAGAIDAAMGYGNPVALAELQPGETVVDLGCGAGLDVLLAARDVGPRGRVIGVDLIEGLVALARRHAAEAAAPNVELVVGRIERLPLPDECADVVISNGTVSLAQDKAAVFTEAGRVLKPGGRLVCTDFVLRDGLSAADLERAREQAGCLGALPASEVTAELRRAGLGNAAVSLNAAVNAGMFLGTLTATKPAGQPPDGEVPDGG